MLGVKFNQGFGSGYIHSIVSYSFGGLEKGSNTKVLFLRVRCMISVSSFRRYESYKG